MSDLRLFLLLIGIAILVLIYILGTLQTRKKQRQQTIQQGPPFDDIANLKMDSRPATDVDYSSVLAGLNQSISQSREEPAAPLSGQEAVHDIVPLDQESADNAQAAEGLFSTQDTAKTSVSSHKQETTDATEQRIVALYIIPKGNEVIAGKQILSAVAQLELQFGEMEIFHHYGVGEMKMKQAIFSLANMLEPGSFDMKQIETFNTRGLVMFLCLPSAIDGQIVFELMLNTSQRLADLLGADVCDANRVLIDEQKIESIRNSIAA